MIQRFLRVPVLLFLVGLLSSLATASLVRADVPQLPGGVTAEGPVDCG